MNHIRQLVSVLPVILAGTSMWTGAFLLLRRKLHVPGAVAAAPVIVGGVATMLLGELGSADADSFATIWVLSPATVVVVAFLADKIGSVVSWLLVAVGLLAQFVGIIDGGPAISVGLPGLGEILTADVARLCLVLLTATVAGPLISRLAASGTLSEARLVGVAGCWVLSVALSLAARDLGQAFLTVVVATVLLHTLRRRLRVTAQVIAGMAVALALAVAVLPHARDRLDQFTNLGRDQRLEQGELALFAASSGGVLGVGLGKGGLGVIGDTTGRDWLLAVNARVFGLLGVIGVMAALAAAGSACLRLAVAATTGSGRLLAAQAGAWILAQLVISSAGVFAVAPETGLAPPFFGAGRTSVVVFTAVMALAASAAQPPPARRYHR